jgi:hypothetical protein
MGAPIRKLCDGWGPWVLWLVVMGQLFPALVLYCGG